MIQSLATLHAGFRRSLLRRVAAQHLLALIYAGLACAFAHNTYAESTRPPNIVLIMADDNALLAPAGR